MQQGSPLRGLERISEELKIERDKCKAAVQDRTKLKIEVDGLKNQIQSLIMSNEEFRIGLEEAENKVAVFREAKAEMEATVREHGAAVKAADQKVVDSEEQIKSISSSYATTAQELEDSQKEVHDMVLTVNVLEAKIASKDESLSDSASEIQRLRRQQEAADQKHALVVNQLNDHLRASESLKTRAHRAEKAQESLDEVQQYNAELQKELDESIAINSQLRVEIHELTQDRMESSAYEDEMLDQMKRLAAEKDGLSVEVKELKASSDELMKRLAAEGEAAENAQVRAKVSARGREFVDQQIEELKIAHTRAVDSVREHEKTIADLNIQTVEYQRELDSQKTRTAKFEEMLTQAETSTSMAMEIECLRAQLSEMRKQLMKREMEDEAEKSLGNTGIMEREQNSRNVYEGIILELRTELERVTLSQHEVNQRLEHALRRAARVDQLEDEVQMYKDAAKMTAVESQSVAVSASEALERSEKSTHEKQLILRDLRKIDLELQSSKSLCSRVEEELRDEKVKSKRIHLDKLTAERKAAELLAGKSRAEALLDDLKQSHDGDNLELHRARSILKDNLQHIEDYKKKLSAVELDKKICDQQEASLRSANMDSLGRIRELESELNMYHQKMENMTSELVTVKHSHMNHKKVYDENQGEIIRLRGMIDEMQNDREKVRSEVATVENNRTEIQLSSLRKDLEMTMNDWRSSEKDRMLKDESINQYRVELSKEKEKYSLMKTQVSLLEDRLKVALQELSVYRSLDVYHSSMQNELSGYRKSGGGVDQFGLDGSRRSPGGAFSRGQSPMYGDSRTFSPRPSTQPYDDHPTFLSKGLLESSQTSNYDRMGNSLGHGHFSHTQDHGEFMHLQHPPHSYSHHAPVDTHQAVDRIISDSMYRQSDRSRTHSNDRGYSNDRPGGNDSSYGGLEGVRMEVDDLPSASQYHNASPQPNYHRGAAEYRRELGQKDEKENREENKHMSGHRPSSKAAPFPPVDEKKPKEMNVEFSSFPDEDSDVDVRATSEVDVRDVDIRVPDEGSLMESSIVSNSSISKVPASRIEREERLKTRQVELFNKMKGSKGVPTRPSASAAASSFSTTSKSTTAGKPSQPSRRPSKTDFEKARKMLATSKL